METQFSKNINDITSSVDRSNVNTIRKEEEIKKILKEMRKEVIQFEKRNDKEMEEWLNIN